MGFELTTGALQLIAVNDHIFWGVPEVGPGNIVVLLNIMVEEWRALVAHP
jgi:hypothetical protein